MFRHVRGSVDGRHVAIACAARRAICCAPWSLRAASSICGRYHKQPACVTAHQHLLLRWKAVAYLRLCMDPVDSCSLPTPGHSPLVTGCAHEWRHTLHLPHILPVPFSLNSFRKHEHLHARRAGTPHAARMQIKSSRGALAQVAVPICRQCVAGAHPLCRLQLVASRALDTRLSVQGTGLLRGRHQWGGHRRVIRHVGRG